MTPDLKLDYYLTEAAIADGLEPPARGKYAGDAGIDLRALKAVVIPPHSVVEVPTGVGFQIPHGWYGLICNRTSWGKRGLLPMGHVVDSGYNGEIVLILLNTQDTPLELGRHERVAQMVVMPVFPGPLHEITLADVKHTDRGGKRLGSSGRT